MVAVALKGLPKLSYFHSLAYRVAVYTPNKAARRCGPRASKARSMVAQQGLRSFLPLGGRHPRANPHFMHLELGCPRVLASRGAMPCVGLIGLKGYLDELKTFDIKTMNFMKACNGLQ